MSDKEKMSLAFDILVSADVMREYDNNIWVSIDRESWEVFFADEEQD
jgi:ABC-type uncharacterized transport system substrate-binding protein